ncbi:CAF1-domain-containing protein [Acrodontium crateriforme]|uniref:CAF1-domain-containing protein n=1 Tax=Acrodontium crateriforme TaxID=150365 RepID=A0AAQ3M8T1_9PEZI|nr:CAF1-domain-containing protein [Acrodontium crateriforme]
MDLDKTSFYPLLLDVLTDISTSVAVAIDFEHSGIPSFQARSGRQTLQSRYEETKVAAERYQILQIGITCIQQDIDNKKYVLQPYNADLCPVINERGLDVERIFSFQSGAAEFLLRNGFDIGRPFHSGVPYLSRKECREARDKYAKRQDKDAVPDMQIKTTDVQSLKFLEDARLKLNRLRSYSSDSTTVDIGPDDYAEADENGNFPPDLSRYEKRLVHQLVRAEYPEFITISKRGYIQIARFNKEREERFQADRTREFNERINRQKGFRWVIEALLGRDLVGLDLRDVARDPSTGGYVFPDMTSLKAQFHRAAGFISGNPRVLVGHNCFLDLVYLYHTFIGTLPDTVSEFQQNLHKLWPIIIDTKYMSTHNCGDINPVSSLEQIASQLSAQQTPALELDEDHGKYQDVEALHEAGYDSYLTAQILTRLSSKLEPQAGEPELDSDDDAISDITIVHSDEADEIARTMHNLDLSNGANNEHEANEEMTATANGDHETTNDTTNNEPEGFTPSELGFRWKGRGDPTIPPNSPDDPFKYDPTDLKHHYTPLKGPETFRGGMPCFNTDFWKTYGNKLRVFGTEEGICVLDPEMEEKSDGSTSEEDGGVEVECP